MIELRSDDTLEPLQQKMQEREVRAEVPADRNFVREYLSNGLRLGWLVNPQKRQVEIYRANQDKQVLENLKHLDGEDVLPDFVFDLSILWG